jgi:hypothetical protein
MRCFDSSTRRAGCGLQGGPQIFLPFFEIVFESAIVVTFAPVVHTCPAQFFQTSVNVVSDFVKMLGIGQRGSQINTDQE